jgi:hypothetical protein
MMRALMFDTSRGVSLDIEAIGFSPGALKDCPQTSSKLQLSRQSECSEVWGHSGQVRYIIAENCTKRAFTGPLLL